MFPAWLYSSRAGGPKSLHPAANGHSTYWQLYHNVHGPHYSRWSSLPILCHNRWQLTSGKKDPHNYFVIYTIRMVSQALSSSIVA